LAREIVCWVHAPELKRTYAALETDFAIVRLVPVG
jgi:hypothetical protein